MENTVLYPFSDTRTTEVFQYKEIKDFITAGKHNNCCYKLR